MPPGSRTELELFETFQASGPRSRRKPERQPTPAEGCNFRLCPRWLQVEAVGPGMCDFPIRREAETGNCIPGDFFTYFFGRSTDAAAECHRTCSYGRGARRKPKATKQVPPRHKRAKKNKRLSAKAIQLKTSFRASGQPGATPGGGLQLAKLVLPPLAPGLRQKDSDKESPCQWRRTPWGAWACRKQHSGQSLLG